MPMVAISTYRNTVPIFDAPAPSSSRARVRLATTPIVVAITMKTKRKHYALRGDMVAMVAQEINYADDMLDLDPSDDWDRVKPDPKAVDGTVKLLESMTVRGLYEPIHNPQLVEMERNIEGMTPDSTPADTPETAPVDLLAGVR